jgi:hypothetical protein
MEAVVSNFVVRAMEPCDVDSIASSFPALLSQEGGISPSEREKWRQALAPQADLKCTALFGAIVEGQTGSLMGLALFQRVLSFFPISSVLHVDKFWVRGDLQLERRIEVARLLLAHLRAAADELKVDIFEMIYNDEGSHLIEDELSPLGGGQYH